MGIIFQIHSVFGERLLPVLIIAAAIYLTVVYKAGAPKSLVARIFPVLVDIQVTLGVIYWIYMLVATSGPTQAYYLSFPFILHPIIGIITAGFAHMAVSPTGPFKRLGRWAPLASLALLLVLVLVNVFIAASRQ